MITQRSEILFLYDCKNCNPNGDPMNANKPRIDDDTEHCLVTDVRLKRTVRDFLIQAGHDGTDPDKDVFIRDFDGVPVTGAERAEKYADREEFVRKFIDVRLFGGVSAPSSKGKKVFNLTGPVQFGMGVSLHPVKVNFIKGTGAFASKSGAQQRTFREEYNITYGLIGFHGVINEQAAKSTHLTETDVAELMQALWDGTKGLLSRSKKGHMPRLLLKIDYAEPLFFIGDLLERIQLRYEDGITADKLTDVADYQLEVSELNAVLKAHQDKIAKIDLRLDDRLKLSEPILKL
ncbi:MAG: type I-B CRISPR-associated protein Cas7/Csh2 [Bacteroidetes bacterium]|nr:MAG: type I-B CRISPR-associated protein Cas7/Csh2 [Bacteroidota bacterium]